MSTTMINQFSGVAKTLGLTLSSGKGQVFKQPVRPALPDDIFLRDLFESLFCVLAGLKDKRRAFDRKLALLHAKMRHAGLSQVRPVSAIS